MRNWITAALIVVAGTAQAELIDRGYWNGWNVMVDTDLGNGCLIQSGRDGKSLTRIGYDALKDQGYLAIFNPDWKRLFDGKTYALTFDLDGRQYPAEVTGLRVSGVPGAGVTFQNLAVYDEIARSKVLSVFNPDGIPVFTLDLTGTAEAIGEARKCQAEMSGS